MNNNKPVLLLETRTEPMSFLTSRSLLITSVHSQGNPVEFCYDYPAYADMICYGQHYLLLDTPQDTLVIEATLGEETFTYEFKLN